MCSGLVLVRLVVVVILMCCVLVGLCFDLRVLCLFCLVLLMLVFCCWIVFVKRCAVAGFVLVSFGVAVCLVCLRFVGVFVFVLLV